MLVGSTNKIWLKIIGNKNLPLQGTFHTGEQNDYKASNDAARHIRDHKDI